MVNTRSSTHTFGQKMVRTKKKANGKRDVSPDAPPLGLNIHGVRMRGPSSSSGKCHKTSSSCWPLEGPTKNHQATSIFDNAMHNTFSA